MLLWKSVTAMGGLEATLPGAVTEPPSTAASNLMPGWSERNISGSCKSWPFKVQISASSLIFKLSMSKNLLGIFQTFYKKDCFYICYNKEIFEPTNVMHYTFTYILIYSICFNLWRHHYVPSGHPGFSFQSKTIRVTALKHKKKCLRLTMVTNFFLA